jgi:hypothetical protein
MLLKLKVTGTTKVTDDRLLVQLQGKYGHAQLNLPINQQLAVRVGDEWTLEHGGEGLGIRGELDETAELPGTLKESPEIRGMRDALSGKHLDPQTSTGLDAISGKDRKP